MITLQRFFCFLFGHDNLCIYNYTLERGYGNRLQFTCWECQRCGKITERQYDV